MNIRHHNRLIHLQPGDRIVVPITAFGISQHHALYFGRSKGIDYIIENKNGIGVRIITASQFLAENPSITRIQPFQGSEADRKHALKKAYALVGTPYELFRYNCEHFANDIQYSVATSPQVKVGIVLGICTLLFLALRTE